jgi:PGAP1-like protein
MLPSSAALEQRLRQPLQDAEVVAISGGCHDWQVPDAAAQWPVVRMVVTLRNPLHMHCVSRLSSFILQSTDQQRTLHAVGFPCSQCTLHALECATCLPWHCHRAAHTCSDCVQAEARAVSISMPAIPGVWVSAEHQCAIWCNQLMQAVAHLLLRTATALHAHAGSEVQHNASSQLDTTLGQGEYQPDMQPSDESLICNAARLWGALLPQSHASNICSHEGKSVDFDIRQAGSTAIQDHESIPVSGEAQCALLLSHDIAQVHLQRHRSLGTSLVNCRLPTRL